MYSYRTEGVILAHKQFDEADKLLTIYTRSFGKIYCIAKGARRPKSKKTGHVELASWCKIYVAHGKNLDILTEVETKRPFGHENLTPDTATKVYHLLELIDYLTEPRQVNSQVFSLLVNFLKKISAGEDFKLLSSIFKVKLLSMLGFFSSRNLKSSSLQQFFQTLESKDYDTIKRQIKLRDRNYLKLLAFLDSIIENLAQKRLKTAKFVLYG